MPMKMRSRSSLGREKCLQSPPDSSDVLLYVNSADTGESRGIAFVLCADDRSVKKAIQMNG